MPEHTDLAHFLSVESIVDHTFLQDTALALAHEPPVALVDDLFPPKPLTLSWSDEFHLDSPHPQPSNNPTPPTLHVDPPPWNNHHALPWPHFHYNYSSQYTDNPVLQTNPPPISVPPPYQQSDSYSAPASASYSSSPLSSSPFSFPPSPLPPDPPHPDLFDPHSHRYVHPSDLSAPATNPEAPDPALSPNGTLIARPRKSPATNKHRSKSTLHPKQRLSAPSTRSHMENPRIRPTRDAYDDDYAPQSSAQALHGKKRKRTPSHSSSSAHTRAGNRIRSTRLRSDTLARNALQHRDDEHDQDEIQDDDDDDDGSYSISNSSYSPSPPPSPGNAFPDNPSSSCTKLGNTEPRIRVPRAPNGPLPLPVPVPNLTKKSRGRKVPSAPSNSGPHASTSAADEDSNSGNVDVDGRRMRGYMCRVPGCGKCFIRGEHLKRHVRSIHTYEKPHACPYEGCDKTFSRRDNLAQHLRVHR